jgi:hypothetical protein
MQQVFLKNSKIGYAARTSAPLGGSRQQPRHWMRSVPAAAAAGLEIRSFWSIKRGVYFCSDKRSFLNMPKTPTYKVHQKFRVHSVGATTEN